MSDGAGATACRAVLTSPAHPGMESAAERKARLKALRAARDDKVGGEKKLKFRNYLPQSEELAPAFEPQHVAQVAQAQADVRMIRREGATTKGQGLLADAAGSLAVTRSVEGSRETVERRAGFGMIPQVGAAVDLERPFVTPAGGAPIALLDLDVAQVDERDGEVRVVFAQRATTDRQKKP